MGPAAKTLVTEIDTSVKAMMVANIVLFDITLMILTSFLGGHAAFDRYDWRRRKKIPERKWRCLGRSDRALVL